MRIKPCPHCGGSACLVANYSYKIRSYFVFVKCDICGATGKTYRSENNPAIDEWNSIPCIDALNAWNMRRKAYEEEEN